MTIVVGINQSRDRVVVQDTVTKVKAFLTTEEALQVANVKLVNEAAAGVEIDGQKAVIIEGETPILVMPAEFERVRSDLLSNLRHTFAVIT